VLRHRCNQSCAACGRTRLVLRESGRKLAAAARAGGLVRKGAWSEPSRQIKPHLLTSQRTAVATSRANPLVGDHSPSFHACRGGQALHHLQPLSPPFGVKGAGGLIGNSRNCVLPCRGERAFATAPAAARPGELAWIIAALSAMPTRSSQGGGPAAPLRCGVRFAPPAPAARHQKRFLQHEGEDGENSVKLLETHAGFQQRGSDRCWHAGRWRGRYAVDRDRYPS